MYNIGICEDGKNVCALIEKMIFKYAKTNNLKLEVYVWYKGESCRDYLNKGNNLDILFLDIELFELNGIELAHFIRNDLDNREIQIVYISSKSSYAQQLFKTQPLDFLIKPIEQPQIDEVLNLAIKIIRQNNHKFEYKSGKEFYSIEMGKIMYFYSEGRKINIVTTFGIKSFYGKLKDIVNNLPNIFITIHHSYIVNTTYIFRYTYETVELTDGTKLSISKANRKQVRERILQE